MKAGTAAVVGLLGALASPSNAATGPQIVNDGNTLLTACKSFLDTAGGKSGDEDNFFFFEMGQCIGVIGGVKATMRNLNGSLQENMRTCFLEGDVKIGRNVRTVVDYLNTHPDVLALDSSLLTMIAFHAAYPCKE
ncbi:Rap1a/Tai family immunity protein [Pseudomonas sp. S3_E11]